MMSGSQSTKEKQKAFIDNELDVVFETFDFARIDRTQSEMYSLRNFATDLDWNEGMLIEQVLDGLGVEYDEKGFRDIVDVAISSYYLMLHFTKLYLETGDFEGLANAKFYDVWKKIDNRDKAKVIEMSLVLEDALSIVHGMYLLLAQVEREEKGV